MILIRADANEKIGAGHVMRCLSIAKAFALRGYESLFVIADERSNALIRNHGFQTLCLQTVWTDMESELPVLLPVIRELQPELLLVDSYCVTENYLGSLSKECRVAYMDDLNLGCHDVDTIINYNIYAAVYDYSRYSETRTRLILHPQYAPLRDEFKGCPKHEMKNVSDVLISAGGADPERITEKIIYGVCPELPEITFHFIVGALNPRLDEIKKKAEERDNAFLHINEKHMSDLMKMCDVAISAAGTTLYELCACGTPTIAYTLADNQIVAAEQFDAQGIMLNAGDCRGNEAFTGRVKELLKELIKNNGLRVELSTRMQELVDGNGADRIVDALL